MKAAAIRRFFADWRRWELNPIVVKELRQAVRSWAVTGTLLLFLTVLFVTSLVFVVSQGLEPGWDQTLGRSIFGAFLFILALASLMFIPLYVGMRLGLDRRESNLDLLYVSTLSPGRILRGKMLCGAYLAILFFSACMPFMAFTTLLRGVDLPTIFCILVFLFMAVVLANQVAIFIACLPVSKVFKTLVALAAALLLLGATVGPVTFGSMTLVQGGAGAMLATREFWYPFLTVAFLELALLGLLYVLSVAMISPPSANRALPIRMYVSLLWAAGFVAAFLWARAEADVDILYAWLVPSMIAIGISMPVVVSNHDELSLRVRRDIPHSPVRRLLAFPFYNGAAGGLVWILGIAALTYGLFHVMHVHGRVFLPGAHFPHDEIRHRTLLSVAATLLYLAAYSLTALLIHRTFLSRHHPKIAGIIAFLTPGIWAVMPAIVLFFMDQLTWRSMEQMIPGSMLNIYVHNRIGALYSHLAFSAGWFVLASLLCIPWFVRQVMAFRPLRPKIVEPQPATVSVVTS